MNAKSKMTYGDFLNLPIDVASDDAGQSDEFSRAFSFFAEESEIERKIEEIESKPTRTLADIDTKDRLIEKSKQKLADLKSARFQPSTVDGASSGAPEPAPKVSSETAEPTAPDIFAPRIGWQIAIFEAWPAMRQHYRRDPTTKEAIAWVKKNDNAGGIQIKGTDTELWWKPNRSKSKSKEVAFATIENVISGWRTAGRLPA